MEADWGCVGLNTETWVVESYLATLVFDSFSWFLMVFFLDFWLFFVVFFLVFSIPDPDPAVLDPNPAVSDRLPGKIRQPVNHSGQYQISVWVGIRYGYVSAHTVATRLKALPNHRG